MSLIRIIIGLLIAGIFLAVELIAFWYFNLPEMWVGIALFLFVGGGFGLMMEFQTQKRLRRYWERTCTGFRWRRRFPEASKTEIREFLDMFVDAFAFHRKRRCCFSPDDPVMEVYRTVHPINGEPDDMELETLCKMIRKQYRIDLAAVWRENITLGEIYQQTHT